METFKPADVEKKKKIQFNGIIALQGLEANLAAVSKFIHIIARLGPIREHKVSFGTSNSCIPHSIPFIKFEPAVLYPRRLDLMESYV